MILNFNSMCRNNGKKFMFKHCFFSSELHFHTRKKKERKEKKMLDINFGVIITCAVNI